jgi:RNA-directed DNA polymerase
VELREGGESLDFLGFHHRWVRGATPASRRLCFLVRWPRREKMQHARGRLRELTLRKRLLLPVDEVVADLNEYLRGFAGYFRYGNSARSFGLLDEYAIERLALFLAKRHKKKRGYGRYWRIARSPGRPIAWDSSGSPEPFSPPDPTGSGPGSRMPAVKNVGEPCAGKPLARIDAAAGGNQRQSGSPAARRGRLPPTLPETEQLVLPRPSRTPRLAPQRVERTVRAPARWRMRA